MNKFINGVLFTLFTVVPFGALAEIKTVTLAVSGMS